MRTTNVFADPKVVEVEDTALARVQRLRAALRLAGPGAVVTGREALWLYGMPVRAQGAIHLLTGAGPERLDGSVAVERCRRVPEPLLRHGFPVAPLARATVDACRRTPSTGEVRVLALEAVHRGGVGLDELHEELVRAPRRGTSSLRGVLAEEDRRRRADGMRRAAELVELAGLPVPRWSVRLSTVGDVHLGLVDAWWDGVGLAWDAELRAPGSSSSGGLVGARLSRYLASGVIAVHTAAGRLREQPRVVAAELAAAYRLAEGTPRPEVVAHP